MDTSFKPALCLEDWYVIVDEHVVIDEATYMLSWALTILIATSLPTSEPPLRMRARTTFENMPFPREENT